MSEPAAAGAERTAVACVQMQPVVGDKTANVQRSLSLIERAAADGARLIVLPELTNSGYVFASREEAFALAEDVPAGPTCTAWIAAAARLGVTIVAGIA
jgi:N-carbamoylputrescine amidase